MNQRSGCLQPVFARLSSLNGFTLFEILVSIFIFSIIATAVFGLYPSVFSSAKIIDESTGDKKMGQNCLARMTDDLNSLFISIPPLYRPNDHIDTLDPHRFVGGQTVIRGVEYAKLRFVSLSNVASARSPLEGIYEINYYIEHHEDGYMVLKRGIRAFPSLFPEKKPAVDPIICEKVKAFRLRFEDDTGYRHDRWDSDSQDFQYATPATVDVYLEIGDQDRSLKWATTIFLPLVREKTNP